MRKAAISHHLIAILILYVAASPSWAAIAGLELVAGGLDRPTFVTHAPGVSDRLFITEQRGVIQVVNTIDDSVGTFLTIPDTDNFLEGGLLGLAFHPQYSIPEAPGFGKFYVYVTVDEGDPFTSYVREYTVSEDPDVANPTPRTILKFAQPGGNHNAGWIGFSPIDNYLYIASGDGGPPPNGQDRTNLLGNILRIDINGDDFASDDANYSIPADNPFAGDNDLDELWRDEIWAYGLRNPYRDSFDRVTGDLWIGDVGDGAREEINFQPAGSPGGANYGWSRFEGDIDYLPLLPIPEDYVPPVYDYLRTMPAGFEGRAVNGGYVYRGPDPDLQGLYFFSDSQVRNVWTIDSNDLENAATNVDNIVDQLGPLFVAADVMVSFGEDEVGNLFIVDFVGEVFRILTNKVIPGDYNVDGEVDDKDYQVWVANFGTTNPAADGNGDGNVDAADYVVWRKNNGNSVRNLGAGSSRTTVPEPAAIALVFPSCAVLAAMMRRSRSAHQTFPSD